MPDSFPHRFAWLAVALAGVLIAGQTTRAQPSFLQAGGGALPGGGVEAGYVAPGRFYTVEAMAYASRAPAFEAEADLLVAAGVGGALRVGEALRIVLDAAAGYHVDVGVRFGPGLLFRENETRAQKNQRFRLIFDPFVRGVLPLGGRWAAFAEAGAQRPSLRVGLWAPLF